MRVFGLARTALASASSMRVGPLATPAPAPHIWGMKHPLNLIKLCVGEDDPATLEAWQMGRHGPDAPARHVTRMWPRREAELVPGGSLYWVFKGLLLARQRILRLEEVVGADGIRRCALILDREVVHTQPVPRRAFQGWRYLPGDEAPDDLPRAREAEPSLPAAIARELADMGLR